MKLFIIYFALIIVLTIAAVISYETQDHLQDGTFSGITLD